MAKNNNALMRLLINSPQIRQHSGHTLRFLTLLISPCRNNNHTDKKTGGWTEIDQQTDRGDQTCEAPGKMLCLGEVLQCGTSQHIHIKHQEDFYNNSLLSSPISHTHTPLFLSLSLSHSLANLSAAAPRLPPFVFLSHLSPFIRGGRRQISAFLYILR